jgi:CO/xanthine dehydrogenase Mo-binding subunit
MPRKQARAVSVTWDKGPLGALDSAAIRAAWVEMAKEGGHSIRDDGDTKSALTKAASVLDAVYEVPYLAHATMEPQNTTASYRDGACEIWSPNQGPERSAGARGRCARHSARQGHRAHHVDGRRLRPARHSGFRTGSGAGVAPGETAGKADLVA